MAVLLGKPRWLRLPVVLAALYSQLAQASASTEASAELQQEQQMESQGLPAPWTWWRVDAAGLRPAGRQGHVAVELGQRVYVHGGCQQEIRCYSDIHIFDASSMQWIQESFTGQAPEARGGHSAVLVGSRIFTYGGANMEETFSDVHMLDPVKRRWSRVSATSPPSSHGPGRRTGHAAAADSEGRIFIFGGYDVDGNFLNDLWVLSLYPSGSGDAWEEHSSVPAAWSMPEVTGQVPSAREGHTLTYVDGRLLSFGGYQASGETANDVHGYDLETQTWSALEFPDPVPRPRQAHSAVRHGHEIVVAGGCEVSHERPACYNDVWSLSLIDMRWTKRSSDVVTWFAREGHSATFVRGRMFVFGGCELGSRCFDDMAALDTADPCPNECGHHGTCSEGRFCQCTTPGYTGHDCMQPLSCFADCGPHGACSQDGTCSCENGWTGTNCDYELPCPGTPKCSGKGWCLADGSCKCNAGYGGADCSALRWAFAQMLSSRNGSHATKLLQSASWGNSSEDEHVMLKIDPFAVARHEAERSVSKDSDLSNKDFGIESVAVETKKENKCPAHCSFRGLCSDGTCYCQPGFYGEACEMMKDTGRGTQSLLTVLVISIACFITSLTSTVCVMKWRASEKRKKEAEQGYNV